MRKTIIAGNWKMNKTNADAVAMLTELKEVKTVNTYEFINEIRNRL